MKRQSERGIRMALSPCGNEEMGRPGQTVGDGRPPGSQEPSPGRPASSLTSEDPGTPARPLMFKCGRSLGNERTRNSIQMHEDGNLLYKVRLLQTEKAARSGRAADSHRAGPGARRGGSHRVRNSHRPWRRGPRHFVGDLFPYDNEETRLRS